MTLCSLYLLGAPRIERAGSAVVVDTRKATALLAYLALAPGQHTRDALAAFLWPENDEEHARAALRRTLSVLTTRLGPSAFRVDRQHIGLAENWEVDAMKFSDLVTAARNHRHDEHETCTDCLAWLETAATLYRQDFMTGFSLRDSVDFDDWQFFQTEKLRQQLGAALARLVDLLALVGAWDSAITHARRWLALDPLHEPAHRRLMQLYGWSGQQAAGLRQYRECVRVLSEELGVPPLDETTEIYRALLEHRLPPPMVRQAPEGDVGSVAPVAATSLSAAPPPLSPARLPLVGREHEWAALQAVYERTAGSQTENRGGHLIAIEGEAGIGKTRLAEDFLDHVRRQGGQVIGANSYEGEAHLAYAPILSALRRALARPERAAVLQQLPRHVILELGRLLPEIGDPQPPAWLDGAASQTRFFEAVGQVLAAQLAGPRPGVLFLDDAQWADEASLDLITYLVRRLASSNYVILLAWRAGEGQPSQSQNIHRLQRLLADTRRNDRGVALHLDRLQPGAVAALVRTAAPGIEGLDSHLFQETEGLPFFVVEYLALLAGAPRGTPSAPAMPASVRDLLDARVQRVEATARQVLVAAAVIGRSFDFDTVRQASGRSEEETISALEHLASHGLVTELRSETTASSLDYDFSHQKLRTLVYEQTSLARRRLLHRRVADAMAGRHRRELTSKPASGTWAGVVAHHYELAGDAPAAAEYHRLAADASRIAFANAEALSHYQAALALGHPDPEALHEAIGDLLTLAGDYVAALKAFETAAASAAIPTLARLEHKLGGVYQRRGDWGLAEHHYQAALAILGDGGDKGARARVYADWSLNAHRAGDASQAQDLAGAALVLAESAADTAALAQTHNLLGILATAGERPEDAISHLERSLELAHNLADPTAQVAALNNLALACAAHGDTHRALELANEALAMCSAIGDRHREAALHNSLADLLHRTGQEDQAMAHLKRAVRLFADIGEEGGSYQPEIWKLAAW